MKRFLLSLPVALVALAVACMPARAVAQSDMDLQPGIIISLTNLEEHLSDIEHLMGASGMGQMSGLVRMGAAEYIRGIDAEKPLGVMLFFNADNPEKPDFVGFVPITDVEDILDTLAPFVDIDEDGDDIILTTNDGTEITVREKNGYAFIAEDAGMLENLPENPANILESLPETYNLAARVFGQRIPEALRAQAIELIRSGAENEMNNLGDGPEAALQRANFEYSMEQMENFINGTEEVVAGLAIDEDSNRIFIDVQVVGLPDSQLARQSNVLADAPKSNFGGFVLEGSSANLHFCGKMLDEDIEQVQKLVDNLEKAAILSIEEESELSDEEMKAARHVLGDLMNVLRGSLKKGYMDMGASLMLDEQIELVAGLSIAEGDKLESSLKELAKWAENDGAPVEFNFDVSGDNGVRYHEIKMAVPEDEEEVRNMFGETLEIVVGVSDDALYIATGENAMDLLGKCIGGSAPEKEDGVVAQMDLHLLPLLRFVSKFQNAAELQGIADALPEDAGDDRLRMTLRTIENGQQYRFEMQDAVLKVLTEIGQAMAGGGFPQDF